MLVQTKRLAFARQVIKRPFAAASSSFSVIRSCHSCSPRRRRDFEYPSADFGTLSTFFGPSTWSVIPHHQGTLSREFYHNWPHTLKA